MNLRTWLYNIWPAPTPKELAARELDEAERKLLEAHTGQEFAASIISYNQTRIKRLNKFLASQGGG